MAIKLWQQYAVGIAVVQNIFIMSLSTGWSSPMQAKLQNATTSPLGYALTDDQFAAINSIFLPASLFGPLICSALVSILSCRQILLVVLCIQLVGSILMALALNIATLMMGRIILGFASSISISSVVILINEMMSVETRGFISTFMSIAMSGSLLYSYTLGSLSSYYVFNTVNACIVAAHIVVMYFLPESPVYLMKKGDREGAIKVLTQLLDQKVFDAELEGLIPKSEEPKNKWINLRVFTDKANLKSIFLGSTLIGFQALAGSTIIISYMNYIFEIAGSKLNPAIATIIVAALAFVSTLVISLNIDKFRRKTMLIPAYVFSIISTTTLGVYFKLDNDGWDVQSSWGYLPLVTIILFTITGIAPLTFATIGELMTPETKTAISTISTMTTLIFTFVLLSLFNVFINTIGAHGMFFMSSGFGLFLLLIIIFMLPETKGKSGSEIRALLM